MRKKVSNKRKLIHSKNYCYRFNNQEIITNLGLTLNAQKQRETNQSNRK